MNEKKQHLTRCVRVQTRITFITALIIFDIFGYVSVTQRAMDLVRF